MSATRVTNEAWTPARVFLAVSAAIHLPLAVAGLLYDRTFPIGADAAARAGSEHVFGVFETNGWHTLGAVVVARVSLYFAVRPRRARDAALGLGVSHVALVVALVVWDPSTFWIASNGADQVVHSFTAIGGLASGLSTQRGRPARARWTSAPR